MQFVGKQLQKRDLMKCAFGNVSLHFADSETAVATVVICLFF